MIPLTSSGSVPSTTSMIPFLRNSSSIPFAASSSASSPSLRAVFDKSMIFRMTAAGSCGTSLNVNVILFRPAIKSWSLLDANVPDMEPPSVIMIEGKSNILKRPEAPPLENTPNKNITTPSSIPAKEAISNSSTYHPWYYSIAVSKRRLKSQQVVILYLV